MPPRSIGRLVDPLARNAVGGRGAGLGALMLDWPDIVGADVAARCRPGKIGRGQGGSRTLALIVRSGADAVELQHRAPQLLDRVNTYLGGHPITRMTLRQGVMPPLPRRRKALGGATDEQRNKVAAQLAHLADGPLKVRLQSLGEVVLQREEEALAQKRAASDVLASSAALALPQSTGRPMRKRSVPPLS